MASLARTTKHDKPSMLQSRSRLSLSVAFLVSCVGAAAGDSLPPGLGANPTLADPQTSFLPTINLARVVGWQAGQKPRPASDLEVAAYASEMNHPRWLYVLPNGDVLVAETNGPQIKDWVAWLKQKVFGGTIRSWVGALARKYVGARVPSANRITLLRGLKPNGSAELRSVFLDGLHSPFGMALVGSTLYVANTDCVVKFDYTADQIRITSSAVKVADLPAGPINFHWTRTLIANAEGTRLYVGVGSDSNIGENGVEREKNRAAILEIDPSTGTSQVFASGLRNPVGLAWEPSTSALWAVVNERDELGDDLVPDYLTSVQEGAFYGWPYTYFGHHVDPRVPPAPENKRAEAIVPDYALGAHATPLGLCFSSGNLLSTRFSSGAFIGLHGSWNRSVASGYKVVFIPFSHGKPAGDSIDVLTGFENEGTAQGRPAGVAMAKDGALLVADDVGNTIWRVSSSSPPKGPAVTILHHGSSGR
jgi:hypothetical protein